MTSTSLLLYVLSVHLSPVHPYLLIALEHIYTSQDGKEEEQIPSIRTQAMVLVL